MTRCFTLACMLVIIILFGSACQKSDEATSTPVTAQAPAASTPAAPDQAGSSKEVLPVPPVREDFEGSPKVSLFPRIGSFSPEEDDQEAEALWATFIDHLVRTSGPIKLGDETVFAFRSLADMNSVGFFLPLAVQPNTGYRASFRAWTKLPEGGVAGAGIVEFDEFLWIGYQYPRSLSEKHYLGAQPGVQLTSEHSGKTQSFKFRTGPKTRMIHLVFFREGTPSTEPFAIDDIEVRKD